MAHQIQKQKQLKMKKEKQNNKATKKMVANELIKTNENRLKFKIIHRLNVAPIRTRSLALDHNNFENFNFYVKKHTMPKVTTHLAANTFAQIHTGSPIVT